MGRAEGHGHSPIIFRNQTYPFSWKFLKGVLLFWPIRNSWIFLWKSHDKLISQGKFDVWIIWHLKVNRIWPTVYQNDLTDFQSDIKLENGPGVGEFCDFIGSFSSISDDTCILVSISYIAWQEQKVCTVSGAAQFNCAFGCGEQLFEY